MLPVPTRPTLRALVLTVWTILTAGLRVFAWDSLKEGFIDVRPLPRVPRLLALVGLVLVGVFLASILFNDVLRFSGQLELLPLDSTAARGIFVPTTVVPLSYIVIILAWTFLFTGVLHVRGAVRGALLVVFVFFGLPGLFLNGLQAVVEPSAPFLIIGLGITAIAMLGILLALVVLPRLHLPLAFEFALMLGFIGTIFLLNLYGASLSSQNSFIDFVSGYLVSTAVTEPRLLIIPFLFLAGAELINFGIAATGWITDSAQRYGRRWAILILLGGLLAYRWIDFVLFQLVPGVAPLQWLAWAGAALAGVCLIPIALWRTRQPFGDHVPLKLIVGLIVGPLLVAFLIPAIANILFTLLAAQLNENSLASANTLLQWVQAASGTYRAWYYIFIALVGAALAGVAVRRQRYTVAAFGMILAWTQFVWWLMENGRPLQDWRYHYGDMDIWLVFALTCVTVYWAVRKELTTTRALRLLGLALFGWALNNTDLLDNPLSVFFNVVGISFVAFGILWSVLTAGGRFANFDSKQFPRISRIILYLGYVLMTVNVTHWFIVTHNVAEQVTNSGFTATGLRIFGLTAAYLVFVEGGRVWVKEG